MPFPIPDREAEANAENNRMCPEAVRVAKKHAAHIMVAVCGGDDDPIERGKLFVKLTDACCRQRCVTGIYASGVVFEPDFYRKAADALKNDALPVHAWVWFGLYATDGARLHLRAGSVRAPRDRGLGCRRSRCARALGVHLVDGLLRSRVRPNARRRSNHRFLGK